MATSPIAGDTARRLLDGLERVAVVVRRVPVSLWRQLALAGLAVWLIYSMAQLFWLLLPEPELPAPPLERPANEAFTEEVAAAQGAGVDIDQLKSLSLFGEGLDEDEETRTAQQPPGIEQEAVETSLNLTLYGAIPSNQPEFATAIVGDGSQQEGVSPGEEMDIGPRGVTVAKVMHDRVILDNNGRYETLWLYGNGDEGTRSEVQPAQRSAAAAEGPREDEQDASSQDAQDGRDAEEVVGALTPEQDQEEPTEEQVRMVTDVMNVSMYREGGQLVGFRIRPKGNRQVFEELGLEPNDIVTAVNNIGLDDTSRAMEVYRSLREQSRASLEILRDGTTITVDVALDQ